MTERPATGKLFETEAILEADVKPPVRGRHLAALRACALHPLGFRRSAYPSAMQVLAARGFVRKLPVRWQGHRVKETAWFLTEAGRVLLQEQERIAVDR